MMRHLLTSNPDYKAREDVFEGRPHLVVPVIALVEGVIQAMNAPTPELVTAAVFKENFAGWAGRPIYEGHPMIDGSPVSGNEKEILESLRVGTVLNPSIEDDKLKMEAWIDIELCAERAPRLLERLRENARIEISVGAFVKALKEAGQYGMKQYRAAWKALTPDHLALLPEEDQGACSVAMGCGVRAAVRRYPTGHYGPDMKKMLEKAIKEKNAVSKNKDRSLGAVFASLMNVFRGAQSADEMSSNDLSRKLAEAIHKMEPNMSWVEAFYPVSAPEFVVYSCYSDGGSYVLKQRSFSIGENGAVSLGDEVTEVEAVISYEPVVSEELKAASTATEGSSCSCKREPAPPSTAVEETATTGDQNMEFKDILAALTAATPEQKQQAAEALGVKAEAPVVKETETPIVAAAAKTPTFEEVLATASSEVRESINAGLKVAADKKAVTIKALKDSGRNPYSDEELGKMSQVELDRLVALAGPKVKAAVDFSAQGGVKETEEKGEAPAPVDLSAKIRANRGAK